MKNDTRGIAIIITIVLMSAIVAIGLGVTTVVVRELQVSSLLDNSVSAIMAADAGVERALWEARKNGMDPVASYSETLSNGATYIVCPAGTNCRSEDPARVISEGEFSDTTRSLEIEF